MLIVSVPMPAAQLLMKTHGKLLLFCGCFAAIVTLVFVMTIESHKIAPQRTNILLDTVSHAALPELPSSNFPASRYEAAWEKSPFLRRSIRPRDGNWAQDWSLAGMYRHGGEIRVSMKNNKTGEYRQVTNHGGARGDSEFKLVRAHFNRDRAEASAEVFNGKDEGTVRFRN